MNPIMHYCKRSVVLLAIFLFSTHILNAGPVDSGTAKAAGTHFLQQKGLMKSGDTLALYTEYKCGTASAPCFYIFNLHRQGFVIVSADYRSTPILGYSMNGSFDNSRCPDNMKAWLEGYATEISAGIEANAPDNPERLEEWKRLLSSREVAPQPKADSYLIESTWEQGSGYNNYCPVMNGSHVVVGCVATAMAQIIRYYGYPSRGFGKKSYVHSAYGVLSVDFDTTDFDYTLMPNRIRRSSSSDQVEMVSRLCYYCGVAVKMEYQHSGHTTGSGSHNYLVPEGLMHFGYTDAEYYSRANVNDDVKWREMICNEIDNRRPIEYAGASPEGGHAFILDGYNSSNQYHFNWGWGGYADGFYSLNTMQGFTNSQDMVINITPSGWDGHLTNFLVSPDGNGDGTSWQQTNSNIIAATKLCSLANRDIWMKEGIYYGDTTANFAYIFNNSCNIYGGFAGDETEFSQRDYNLHPTVIDGMNRRGAVKVVGGNLSSHSITLNGIVLQNGYSPEGNAVEFTKEYSIRHIRIRNCHSDSGRAVYLADGLSRSITIENCSAPVVCAMNNAIMRQSIIHNNEGTAVSLDYSRIVNSDIVSNRGLALRLANKQCSLVNNIVWNNDSCLHIDSELRDTSIRYCAFDCAEAIVDSTCLLLNSDNNAPDGPAFINPIATRGPADITDADWYLANGSVCIDAGERLQESIRDGDMNQRVRSRNGKIDLGCHETNYPVSISHVASPRFTIHPNPATTSVSLYGLESNAPTQVDIIDMTGRLLLRQQVRPSAPVISLDALPAGVYFIKADGHTSKLIKK
ncbi:MAG: thiol protease/hemagglutinin PrtT [Bacteroidales bacterium]|nr:thiol protease/hemagglutinin PrtT [Bacteroidales bacterium]